jgi:4-amino-4-deoxy-L-arabinose transferase-like glycosyltransferase
MKNRIMPPRGGRTAYALLLGVLGLAAFLRFWQIGSRPGYEWDEPVYENVAKNIALHGHLQSTAEYGTHAVSYLFHPSFYFLMLGGWFKLAGAGITQARVVAATMSIIVLALLFFFLRDAVGWVAALVATTLVSVDGWMIFTNRVSWMENTLMVLVLLSMWQYQQATQKDTTGDYVAAGLLMGATVAFKYTGVYVLVAVLINWLINRNEKLRLPMGFHRNHLKLLVSTLGVIAVYLITMTLIYQHGTGNAFWRDQWVQMQRTFVSSNDTRGSLHTPYDLWRPFADQYKIFVGTVVVAAFAFGLVVYRLWQAWRQRTFYDLRNHSVQFSWLAGGFVVFGVAQLKFPHYFMLVLIPAYGFLVTEATSVLRRDAAYKAMFLRMVVYPLVTTAVVVLGLLGFWWRIVDHHDNALKSLAQYSSATIPHNDVVITEEPIGMMIPQPYCKMWRAASCAGVAKYVITYESHTQHIPTIPGLQQLLQRSTPVKVIIGFKEKLTVWRINS